MSKQDFLESMKNLLGEDFVEFEKTINEPAFRGVYVNELKCSVEKFKSIFPYKLSPTPFSDRGFYLENDAPKLGTHPLHHAGAFYSQEPSAMSAAAVLDVKKGERVLDLCAAPGGKTAAIAGALNGTGLLWSNEYVKQRAFTLLSNCERMGIRNAVISNSSPEKLAKELPCFFDKILVDAPCSGEGMLRREKAEYEKWNKKNISICALRQKNILNEAAKMLRSGGELVYSTCTFNREENEEVIGNFLKNHPEFELLEIKNHFGSAGFGMPQAKRIFPSNGGEGHFAVKLKKGEGIDNVKYKNFTTQPAPEEFNTFYKDNFKNDIYGNAYTVGEKVYILPKDVPKTSGINIIRSGVLAGEMKHKTFFPHHALYSAAKAEECKNIVNLDLNDSRLMRFLHGEEIDISGSEAHKGFCALSVEGIVIGFGKISGTKMKNHYPKGLRNLS